MKDPKHIHISDYNYDLPDSRIAKYPLAERDASKLLIYNHGKVEENTFTSLPDYLPQGALMVFNNTKVIQARLRFQKETGATIEVFCMEPFKPIEYQMNFASTGECQWLCMVGNLKRWKSGVLSKQLNVKGHELTFSAERLNNGENVGDGTKHLIRFFWDDCAVSFSEVLEACGEIPIPPYLNRKTEESDKTTYQTVYSKIKGSVAAPTAGLHFTDRVLADIDAHGIEREELTLHVGAGTFKPVKAERIEGHEMHTEFVSVRKHTIERLLAHEGRCIAVGTTSVRTLESLYYMGVKLILNADLTEEQLHVNQWEPYEGEVAEKAKTVSSVESLNALLAWYDRNGVTVLHSSTQIIIAPGYSYHIVKALVTNFHQPQSTLLLLVSALIGEDWHKVYDYALSHDFRFLSYGDSSLLMPR